jgi:hypothetical protein
MSHSIHAAPCEITASPLPAARASGVVLPNAASVRFPDAALLTEQC